MVENLILALFLFLPGGAGLLLRDFFRRERRQNSRPGVGRLIAGNCLGLLFLVSLIPLAGEIYFRFFDDSTDSVAYTKGAKRWMA
ncbi:MAG: hypothetical protein EPO07_19290, partial [Verrucomicrobia bacterium]